MKKLYKFVENEKFKVKSILSHYLDPEYIYLPIEEFAIIENTNKILINQLVHENDLINYTSSVSGTAEKIDKIIINSKLQDALVVKNDYKEKKLNLNPKNIEHSAKLLNLLNKNPIFKKINKTNIENIVINGIENENYTYTESFILKKHTLEIYDTLELLIKLFTPKKSCIVLQNSEQENINKYLSSIGSYPNVNVLVLDNLQLLEREEYLCKKLNLNIKNTLILKPSELLELRSYFKYNCPKTEKFISIIDYTKKSVQVVNTKKYVKINDLLINLKITTKDKNVIKNKFLTGDKIDINNEIVTNDITAIIITNNENKKEEQCINCGTCYNVCPNKGENCIDCGLCLYYCPSKKQKTLFRQKGGHNE